MTQKYNIDDTVLISQLHLSTIFAAYKRMNKICYDVYCAGYVFKEVPEELIVEYPKEPKEPQC